MYFLYLDDSNISLCFSYERNNSAALDTVCISLSLYTPGKGLNPRILLGLLKLAMITSDVDKSIKCCCFCDTRFLVILAEFALYIRENGLAFHSFRPIWDFLMVEILATRAKFLQPSCYCTAINCAFTFHTTDVFGYFSTLGTRRCPWCNGYRCRKWTRRHKFKSWTRLIAFHISLIHLGKVWIQLFSLQLWVNSRAD